jgi:hypothetical protein
VSYERKVGDKVFSELLVLKYLFPRGNIGKYKIMMSVSLIPNTIIIIIISDTAFEFRRIAFNNFEVKKNCTLYNAIPHY